MSVFGVICSAIFIATAVLLVLELRGLRTTLRLHFKGDLQRETAFLAQYGQAVCTGFAAWIVAAAHGSDVFSLAAWRAFAMVCGPVILTSLVCTSLKRSLGRRRPSRADAGKFTGFALHHDSRRESFPSSHTACAFALSTALMHEWPHAAVIFWSLATVVGVLRYLADAHFPSDVLAGSLLGLLVGRGGVALLEAVLPVA